ncbi:MAG: RHS repeat-associated core domain-containing protein [Phycisphaerales bacterium]
MVLPLNGGTITNGRQVGLVDLFANTSEISDTDLRLPAPGFSWFIGRSFNARQEDSGGSHFDSDGYQGCNWFQNSQPELVFYDDADNSKDLIYLMLAADKFLAFNRVTSSTDTFKAVNGAGGVILLHTFDGVELATFHTLGGKRLDFFWFDGTGGAIDDDIEGSLWRVMDSTVTVDPYDTADLLVASDGNIAYIGDIGDPDSTHAQANGYDGATGAIRFAYDTADRRYEYKYTSIDGTKRLTSVEVATLVDSTWTNTGDKVQYEYYQTGDNTYGDNGCLQNVIITTPLTDSGVEVISQKYFRYWTGTFDDTTNPGHPKSIQYVVDFEGVRNFDWSDSVWDDDFKTATESSLKEYASTYLEYDSNHRIDKAWFNGACGCSGAANGTFEFEYEDNTSFSDTSGYDQGWFTRTVISRPDGSWLTQYFDEVGQPLHKVTSDADPDTATNFWITKVERDTDGRVTKIHSPANINSYTHAIATWALTVKGTTGLITVFDRIATGDLEGLLTHVKHKEGNDGDQKEYLDSTVEYDTSSKTVGDATLKRPVVDARWVYSAETETEAGSGSGPAGAYETTFTYTFYTGDAVLARKKIVTTYSAVTTAKNGSNSTTSSTRYSREDGTTAFVESATGIFTYTQFTGGQLTKRIDDAQTNHATDFATGDDPNGTWGITETGDGLRLITEISYDAQGRLDTTTLNAQTANDKRLLKNYYSKLNDRRLVTLRYNDYETSPSIKYFGPVQYTVVNHAGQAEVQAVVALSGNESTLTLTNHVDESTDDPILAIETTTNELGELAQMTTLMYNKAGQTVQETRSYFLIPASGTGSDGTNYDPTLLAYDDMGRPWRVKDATGTIRRTVFDKLGRTIEQWIGTNDFSFSGGESSGSDNMVKTVSLEYDSGNAGGNGYLTKQTVFVEDSTTDQRVTTLQHDLRGRVLLTTTPTAPYSFDKYDNMGRLIASGQFSSTASIVVGTDDPTTETTNRLALSQTFYDERGQVWKSQRHKIDDADGSDDDNLQTLTWSDAAGRVIKVDGSQLTKAAYDRLGRQTHQFTLADDNDTAYADADDVTSDIVLLESQTTYESTDSADVLMRATISRHHDDNGFGATTGALDTNADNDDLLYTAANVKGRIQITAMWYDRFGRVTDSANYGMYDTNSDGNFDDFERDGLAVPTRSDTILLSENAYNTDGTLQSITDPRDLETRFVYDELGRQTAIIANYVNGTPSGDNGDDDVFTRYVFTDGLRTKMWVDFDGDDTLDTGDQETIYTFSTTKGVSVGDSKIQTGHLLQKVQYPDSSGGTDVVTFAYNAQSQQSWTKDQEGNIIETDFDDSGRVTHKRITTLDADFDGAVRRISTTYDSLGRRQLVTQHDNATVGSGSVVDEVKFTYEDWGNVSKFEQDHDSAIGGSLLYDVDYTYAKATGGRNTIRRSTMDLPDGNVITFHYNTAVTVDYDDEASRVDQVKDGSVILAIYDYNGVGQVVRIDHPEPDIFMHRYSGGSYDRLDRFDRVEDDIWTKDLATDVDFFDLDITYDRNSNITAVVDNIHVDSSSNGLYDTSFTIDNLNRLTKSQWGDWNGSALTNEQRETLWTLTQTGNWDIHQLDLEDDDDYNGTGEFNDDRTHNDVNELTGRDTDDNGTDNYTLTYDAVGNLTDDAENYEYEYDPFGRLRKVKKTSDQTLVAEYTYSGLGHRIGWHYDVDSDNDVDANDPWIRFVYDERWRIVGTFRASDSSPKEQFVYHNAGADGRGGSSYIDTVICRDRDANVNWADAADGTLEERLYYCHNWRGDVSVLIEDDGDMVEWVKYSSYGIPFGLPKGDQDSDGDLDSTDVTAIQLWGVNPYDVRADLDLDGDVDSTDGTLASNASPITLGWGNLSLGPDSGAGNRKGYAGYELDPVLAYSIWHVRLRVFNSDLGRWVTRDPMEYIDGANLYEYVRSNPMAGVDPQGTFWHILLLCAQAVDSCRRSCNCCTAYYKRGGTIANEPKCCARCDSGWCGGSGGFPPPRLPPGSPPWEQPPSPGDRSRPGGPYQ